MPTIISILSDQLIPNVLFIKQMAKQNDYHVFLSTEKMESRFKSQILSSTLNLQSDGCKTIIIDPNNPKKITDQLSGNEWEAEASYIINITGGTKMMSQNVYSFFSRFKNANIFYWPIEYNYLEQLSPEYRQHYFENPIELDLKTYFSVQGYSYQAKNSLSYSYKRAEVMMQRIQKHNDAGKIPDIVLANHPGYLKDDRGYLTGGWFEEWMYQTVKEALKLNESQIAYNLKLKSRFSEKLSESDNEIDVAFVYKNNLFIIECKVFSQKQLNGSKITNCIYKISSLRQSLGLKATAVVAILTFFGKGNERWRTIDYLKRMAGVTAVFSLEAFKERNEFIKQIKSIVNYG